MRLKKSDIIKSVRKLIRGKEFLFDDLWVFFVWNLVIVIECRWDFRVSCGCFRLSFKKEGYIDIFRKYDNFLFFLCNRIFG